MLRNRPARRREHVTEVSVNFGFWEINSASQLEGLRKSARCEVEVNCRSRTPAQLGAQFAQSEILLHVLHHPLLLWMVQTCPCVPVLGIVRENQKLNRKAFADSHMPNPACGGG